MPPKESSQGDLPRREGSPDEPRASRVCTPRLRPGGWSVDVRAVGSWGLGLGRAAAVCGGMVQLVMMAMVRADEAEQLAQVAVAAEPRPCAVPLLCQGAL